MYSGCRQINYEWNDNNRCYRLISIANPTGKQIPIPILILNQSQNSPANCDRQINLFDFNWQWKVNKGSPKAFEYSHCHSYSFVYSSWQKSDALSDPASNSIISLGTQSGYPVNFNCRSGSVWERWNFVRDIRMGRILICLNEILIKVLLTNKLNWLI